MLELSLRDDLGKALKEPGGWEGIAKKSEWGLFKFGHTYPNQSNSGLMTLVLMAYDFHKKNRGLERRITSNPEFQTWMNAASNPRTTGMSNSHRQHDARHGAPRSIDLRRPVRV